MKRKKKGRKKMMKLNKNEKNFKKKTSFKLQLDQLPFQIKVTLPLR